MVIVKAQRRTAAPAKRADKAPPTKRPASSGASPKPAAKAALPRTLAQAEPTTHAKAKNKLVRDSFTIPKTEYAVLQALKLRAANLKRPIKKSELLRAGVAVLQTMTDKAFLAALSAVPSLKTGRPRTNGAPSSVATARDLTE